MSWVMIGTAAAGAVAGKMKNDAAQKRQQQTANAAADAQKVSWARRDGQGFIPQVQYNQGNEGQAMFEGGLSGAMFGQKLGQGIDWSKMSGAGEVNPYDKATSGGFLGTNLGASYDPNIAKGYGAKQF